MIFNFLLRKALSSCLMVALLATYSMVSLASTSKIVGDLTAIGSKAVLINGEAAKSGRSIFSSNTIVTPEGSSAIVSIGKLGKLEIAQNSTFTLNFDENGVTGDLTVGKVTVLASSLPVAVKTAAGLVNVNTGESAISLGPIPSQTPGDDDEDDDDDESRGGWWWFALGMGGAMAGIVYATTHNSNKADLGGGSTVISPVR